jgi:hypothetical protein
MQTRRFPSLPGLAFAVLCAMLAGRVGAHPVTFEGTWLNTVNVLTCPPAPREVLATFPAMITYLRGGVLIEGGAPAGPPPAVSQSAGHGIWARTGAHAFRVFFRTHGLDDQGRLVRITDVTTHPRLIEGDNPETPEVREPYYLTGEGTNTITTLNPTDGTVIDVTEGCNDVTSRPVVFAD